MFITMQRHRWPPNPCLLVAGLLLATCSTVQVCTDMVSIREYHREA